MYRQLTWIKFGIALVVLADLAPADEADGAGFRGKVKPFLEKHCVRCHGEYRPEGVEFRVDQLTVEATPERGEAWHMIREQLASGDMPPADEKQPAKQEVREVLDWLGRELLRVRRALDGGGGQLIIRRLNREQYNNTLQNLLGLPSHYRPADSFPPDDTALGFRNIGRALVVSPYLMEKYLATAEDAAHKAIVTGPPPPQSVKRYEAEKHIRQVFDNRGGKPGKGHLVISARGRGRVQMRPAAEIQSAGEYVIRLRTWGKPVGPIQARLKVSLDNQPIYVADVTASQDEPSIHEVRTCLEPGQDYVFRIQNVGKEPGRRGESSQLYLDYVECEGPLYDQWPPPSHCKIFGELKGQYVLADARGILERFALRAFRRPATREELDQLMRQVKTEIGQGASFEEAIRLAVQSILCSPQFLYLPERRGGSDAGRVPLDDFELAARLSYFLWCTMPDDELFELAAAGKLTDPHVLLSQVARMIKAPQAEAFVRDFVGQWLLIDNLGAVDPDPKLYPTFDEHLRTSMRRETEQFFLKILREDLSVMNFIDSDFAMLNGRLARHYGIADVAGDRFRPVKLQAEHHRGGLLTQASIATVTADGFTTSPIRRGVYVLEQILADPPPPPPVTPPEVPPNKGKHKTVRQQLEQHRRVKACANCHMKIDPLGFAMENYNPIGSWRMKEEQTGLPIDPSGNLPDGTEFADMRELKQILLQQDRRFLNCLAEKLMIYALGRDLDFADYGIIDEITKTVQQDGYRMSAMIEGIVTSRPFLTK